MKKRSEISELALEAKRRLKNYSLRRKTEEISYKQANFSREDLEMYRKVAKLLSQEKVVLNPILELVDKNLYSKLNSSDRQKYIMMLTEKYRQMKSQYEREKSREDRAV